MKINFNKVQSFRGVDIYEQANKLAYAYETPHAAADADGAPNSYSPSDIGKPCSAPHVGLDCLQNAGYRGTSWWNEVLVPDKADPSTAFVQTSGPGKGFFLSMTALRKGDLYSASTYVDATTFPYVVIPTGFPASYSNCAKQGDVGYATYLASGAATAFIVADAGGGPKAQLGEASIALFAAIGFPNANPRTGAGLPTGDIQYILFPGSGKSINPIWPRTNADIQNQVTYLLQNTPGIEYQGNQLLAASVTLQPRVAQKGKSKLPQRGAGVKKRKSQTGKRASKKASSKRTLRKKAPTKKLPRKKAR
jgi:hypothetical protein